LLFESIPGYGDGIWRMQGEALLYRGTLISGDGRETDVARNEMGSTQ